MFQVLSCEFYKIMLPDLKKIVKNYKIEIILLIAVILISSLSFAIGYIMGGNQGKEPLNVEEVSCRDTNYVSLL